MLGYASSSIRSFTRRYFSQMAGNSRASEENSPRTRSTIYSTLERLLGRHLPLLLFAILLTLLIGSAIITTALYGVENSDFSARSKVLSPVDNVESSKRASQLSQPQNFQLIFLMVVFVVIFTAISLIFVNRIWRRLSVASTSRLNSQNTPYMSSNSGRLNQMLARLVQMGRVSDAAALRSRLRLAMISRDFDGNDYEMLQGLDDQNPHAGATEGEISRLPVHVLTQANIDNGLSESSKSCSICLAPYEVGESIKTVICLVSLF